MTDDDKPRWIVTRQTVKEVFAEGVPMDFINADTLSLWGRPVEIVNGYEGDLPSAILICAALQGPLGPAQAVAPCDECGRPIVHMANVPKTIKRVCIFCGKRLGCFDV